MPLAIELDEKLKKVAHECREHIKKKGNCCGCKCFDFDKAICKPTEEGWYKEVIKYYRTREVS